MKRKSFITIILIVPLFFLLCGMSPVKEEGDTYWYVNGSKYYWYYQPDVFAFRKMNGEPWSGMLDTNYVKFIFHRGMHSDKMNVLYFKQECSEQDKQVIKETIRSSGDFETEFPVITLFPEQPYDAEAWFAIDDLLLVNFHPDSINQTTFNAFKQKYDLAQINFPDSVFPEGIATYVFQMNSPSGQGSTIDLARIIYTQDSGFVQNVQPNLIYAYEPASDENINLLNSGGNGVNARDIEYYLMNNQSNSVRLFVHFKVGNPQAVVKVYDLFGREMTSYEIQAQKTQVEILIEDYTSGIYFVSIENKRGEALGVEKFLKL